MTDTVNTSATDGNTTMCGASNRWLRPSLSIAPQLGVGGAIPRPRKLNDASNKNRCRHPDAGLNQNRLNDAGQHVQKENPRAGRAKRSGSFNELQGLDLQDLASRQPRVSSQTNNTQSENQAIDPRSQKRHQCDGEENPGKCHQRIDNDDRHEECRSYHPTYPANPPMRTPMIPESKTTVAPTRMLTRVPNRTRERISRPNSSLPKG